MNILDAVQRWLAAEGITPSVDQLPVAVGKTGLFPLGCQVLWHKKDVLGGVRRRVRYLFLLRQMAIPGEDTEKKFLELQRKARENPPEIGENQTFFGEKGKYVQKAGTGLGIYELRLVAEREETQ